MTSNYWIFSLSHKQLETLKNLKKYKFETQRYRSARLDLHDSGTIEKASSYKLLIYKF
jgi:hypothetical protein